MRTEGCKGVLLSAFLIAMLLMSVLLPLLTLTLTCSQGESIIWTVDDEGDPGTEFADENVYIHGSGFIPDASISISIILPDNSSFDNATTSDNEGSFIYAYELPGITGTYTVTAMDGTNEATTTFANHKPCLRVKWNNHDSTKIVTKARGLYQNKSYYIKYYGPDDVLRGTSDTYTDVKRFNDIFFIQPTLPSALGDWTVKLYENGDLHKKVNVNKIVWTTDSSYSTLVTSFERGETVYFKAIGLWSSKYYKSMFETPSKVKIYVGDWTTGVTSLTGSYSLSIDAEEGMWKLHIRQADDDTGGGEGHYVDTRFTVTAPTIRYYLTVTTDPPGVGAPTGEGWYNPGSYAPISADEHVDIAPGTSRYRFDGWTTDNMAEITDPSSPSTTVLMDENKTVTANYVIQYYLTVATDPSGLSPAPSGEGWYDESTDVSLTAPSPSYLGAEEYLFTHWDVDGTTVSGNPINVSMNAAHTATAHYAVVSGGVDVFISPESKSGISENVLTYTVTVRNKGNISDNYALTVSDNENWDPTLSENSILVPAGGEDNTTLSVKIPRKTFGGKNNNITVTASGTSVENSAAAIANVEIVRGVDVTISPSYQENLPGENLIYIVTVTNLGNVEDNYDLSVSQTEDWEVIFWFTFIDLPPYCSAQSELIVIIPEDAIPGTSENITVTAVSKTDNTVTDSDSCIAQAKIIREVEVSISPENRIGLPGENLTYTVTVANMGNVPDNYALENIDTLGWSLSLSEDLLEVENGMSESVTLTVAIPDDAIGRTLDNITVTATSQENENVWDSASCLARVKVVVGIYVRIEPDWQRYFVGENLSYTVTVVNTGNVPDNYTLTVEDNAGWGPWLSDNLLENIWPGENKPATLRVTIPENATAGTEDNIIAKAISAENAEISDNDSCIARATVPKAEFNFITLYKVSLDVNLLLDNGSKLVVKFYKYDNTTFQAESVFDEFTPPKHVENIEDIPHPLGLPVEIVTLFLTTDNTEEEIYTVASFVVRKVTLMDRVFSISMDYPSATPEQRQALMDEIFDISMIYPSAPP